jgi:hypothetical protein
MPELLPAITLVRRLLASLLLTIVLVASPGALAQDPFGLMGGTAPEEPSAPAATPLETLIEVLKDDTARQALIEELEARAAQEPAAGEPAGAAGLAGEAATIGGEIAQFTQEASESAAETVNEVWRQLRRIPALFSALGAADYSAIGWIVLDLLAVVVITYGTYFAIRFLTERFRRLVNLRAVAAGRVALILAAIVILASNLAMVLAAWAGNQAETVEIHAAAVQEATARGNGAEVALAQLALAVLHNGLGNAAAQLHRVRVSGGQAGVVVRHRRGTSRSDRPERPDRGLGSPRHGRQSHPRGSQALSAGRGPGFLCVGSHVPVGPRLPGNPIGPTGASAPRPDR